MFLFTVLALSSALATEPDRSTSSEPFGDIEGVQQRFSGVGIGYDNGLWGSRFSQGLKLDIPIGNTSKPGGLGRHFGVRLRGVVVHDDFDSTFMPVAMGGAELFGRGPVLLGVLRVYGGGGLWVGSTVSDPDASPNLAGGGHYGVEFLVSPRTTFTFEVGGQGPVSDREVDAGASVMAGATWYLGKAK